MIHFVNCAKIAIICINSYKQQINKKIYSNIKIVKNLKWLKKSFSLYKYPIELGNRFDRSCSCFYRT